MSRYDDRYQPILDEVAKGRSDLTGVGAPAQGFPRYEYMPLVVQIKKGGLMSKGGPVLGEELIRDVYLGDGWEVASVETHPDFLQFHLQRRHEPNCQCADCGAWRQFRARLPQ